MKVCSVWSILLCLLSAIVCGCEKKAPDDALPSRSNEESRLERAGRLDSTLIRAISYIDSVGWTVDGMAQWKEQSDALSAEAWMLVEDSTGLLISEKNADQRMYMASLTKMMTCLLALENGRMDDTIRIAEEDCVTKDSRMECGDSYLVGDLIREMMLQSDNDAAYALARHIGGDTLTFCQMMNRKATYLGMDGTHFANPNGMPNDSNFSTAHDLLVLSRYCMSDTAFAQIVGTPFMDVPLLDGRHLPCQNTNNLLGQYEGCIGIKTGFTRQAGNCLASAATRNGVTLVLVLLKSRSRSSRFDESAILLDYGFRVMQKYQECTPRPLL